MNRPWRRTFGRILTRHRGPDPTVSLRDLPSGQVLVEASAVDNSVCSWRPAARSGPPSRVDRRARLGVPFPEPLIQRLVVGARKERHVLHAGASAGPSWRAEAQRGRPERPSLDGRGRRRPTVPGDNELARRFRPVVKGRGPHDTHRGLEECRAFAEEFVERRALAPDGGDAYTNRAVSFLGLRWGRLTVWEDYEDTQRSADWDQQRDRERSMSAG
jgi:hypothetical protein